MALPDFLRIAAVAVALSGVTPAILAVTRMVEPGVLWIVFVPSVVVALLTAGYARRHVTNDERWNFTRGSERISPRR